MTHPKWHPMWQRIHTKYLSWLKKTGRGFPWFQLSTRAGVGSSGGKMNISTVRPWKVNSRH